MNSEDFFGVEKYPTAKFAITKVVPQGPGRYKVEGDLTIKETTKPIKFTKTTKIIDRILWNEKAHPGKFRIRVKNKKNVKIFQNQL